MKYVYMRMTIYNIYIERDQIESFFQVKFLFYKSFSISFANININNNNNKYIYLIKYIITNQ